MFTPFLKKTFRCIAIVGIASTMLFSGTVSSEASKCGSRTLIVKQLTGKFSETLRSRGLISNKLLMELFASEKGSWSILFTSPKGRTCVVATGQMWLDDLHKKDLPGA